MNFQNPNFDHVEKRRSSYPTYRSYSSDGTPPTSASQVTVLHAPLRAENREQPSPSPQLTVISYSPSCFSTPSAREIYGPDRCFGHKRAVTYHAQQPVNLRPPIHFNEQEAMVSPPPISNWESPHEFKNEQVREVEASITPGVETAPLIRNALDALTRVQGIHLGRCVSENRSSGSNVANPMYRYMPNSTPGLFEPLPVHLPAAAPPVPEENANPQSEISPDEELAALRANRRSKPTTIYSGKVVLPGSNPSTPRQEDYNDRDNAEQWLPNHPAFAATALPKAVDEKLLPRQLNNWQAQSELSNNSEQARKYPQLRYKPWVLTSPSLALLGLLSILMIVAIILCAAYSSHHDGLVPYSGTIYGGNYFVFRILPQLLSAILLFYAQSVIATTFRILPFSAMASDDVQERRLARFFPIYPMSFLWPRFHSTWHIWIPSVNIWLLNITIPVQSSLFTVVLVNGTWRWSAVQGVAWILVALYIALLLSIGILFLFWRNRRTGMLPGWDLRSIADVISLLNQSNAMWQYEGTETAETKRDLERMLHQNIDRLGWWFAPNARPNFFYGVGAPAGFEDVRFDRKGYLSQEENARGIHLVDTAEIGRTTNRSSVCHRYMPWCFRNNQVTLWATGASIMLIALLVVSLNPSTELKHGFLPGLSAAPVSGAFSGANFLYSFIPSLLGLILFLLFQSLDLTLRVLTPWGELQQRNGSRARTSILADYSASFPLSCGLKASKNGHYRVAFISLLSTVFLLIPILAGGMFQALTPKNSDVRIYPNIAVFAILLTLLVLYLIGLVSLVPRRDQFRLPHAVTCLAEIISFCSNEELRTDEAFSKLTSMNELKENIGAYSADQDRWYFGTGRLGDERLGIKRYNKYTLGKKSLHVAQQIRRKNNVDAILSWSERQKAFKDTHGTIHRGQISRPVVEGSSSMF